MKQRIYIDQKILQNKIFESVDDPILIRDFDIEIEYPKEFVIPIKDIERRKIIYNLNEGKLFELTVPSGKSLSFNNCQFRGFGIKFISTTDKKYDENTSLTFDDCDINIEKLLFEGFNLPYLSFNLKLSNSNLEIGIFKSFITEIIEFENVYKEQNLLGFKIEDSEIGKLYIDNSKITNFNIDNSEIKNLKIVNSEITNFKIEGLKKSNEISITNSIFYDFEIDKIYGLLNLTFEKNRVNGIFKITSKSIEKQVIKINESSFEQSVYFNYIIVSLAEFSSVFFRGIVTFNNFICNSIRLDATHFDKVSFFEDFEINEIDDVDINTIRVIKNQFSKTDNKIEYLNYHAIELNKKLKDTKTNWKDIVILWLSKWSNYYGTSWGRGVIFTFGLSIFFFILILVVNSYIKSDYPLCFNPNNKRADFSIIMTEYFNLIFRFGFNDAEKVYSSYLYIIYILAKIFISYGIYQTIQAFRKFGKI
jgi:hypothetical protein